MCVNITSDCVQCSQQEHSTVSLITIPEILVNSRKKQRLKYPTTNSYLELDIWIPNLRLCFEFQVCFGSLWISSTQLFRCCNIFIVIIIQDSYHYVTTWYKQNSLEKIQQKDSIQCYPSFLSLISLNCSSQTFSLSIPLPPSRSTVSHSTLYSLLSLLLSFFSLSPSPLRPIIMVSLFPSGIPHFILAFLRFYHQ